MRYGKNYYKQGNYQDYLQRKFDVLAKGLIAELNLRNDHKVIDFGCGYGGLIHEFCNMGYGNMIGTDISNWAIEYGREAFPEMADKLLYYNLDVLSKPKTHVLFLDVLEHIPVHDVNEILRLASGGLEGFVIARIPVSLEEGKCFALDVSNNDPTHINCHCRDWWLNKFNDHGYIMQNDIVRKAIYTSAGVLCGKWRFAL